MNAKTEHLDTEMQTLRAELERLRDDLGSIVKTASDVATDAGSAATETVCKAAKRASASVTKEIEQRPLTSIGISFFVGLVLGVLFGRWR